MAEEPLLTKTISCPACEQKVPLQMANPRLYTVASRESDRHVTGYRWLREIATSIVPHHYKIWQCPKCLFADFVEKVDKEKPDGTLNAVREMFIDISIEKKMVLDTLRELVPKEEMDHAGAVAIHLAALLIAGLPSTEHRMDHSKLGRIALRLAWLFREADGPAVPEAPSAGRRAMEGLASATERLDRLVKETGEALWEVQKQGKLRGVELRLPDNAEGNPYLALGELIEVRLKTLQAEITTLQMAVLQDQQGRMASAVVTAPEGAGDLDKALIGLTSLWPAMPRTERECLLLALTAFEVSYENEIGDESEEQSMAQVNLILDILVRLGELDRALEWTTHMAKYAADTASDLQDRISKGKMSKTLSAFDETVINRKIAALGLTRQKAGESRRDVLELMLDRDREKIDGILRETSKLPAQERMKALEDQGIHSGVLTLISKELSANPKESAGWFKKLLK